MPLHHLPDSTIPPGCEILEVPTLSIDAASDTFHRIYKHGERSDLINDILKELDSHLLSTTLLATVAQHNKWDTNRITREWRRQRTGVLRTQHSGSLAATIELSLASPLFQGLGPDARELLGVTAFFPQGVDERNINWLFLTISEGPDLFDKFCILSLTHRSNGFITILAPLRDYLHPKDPQSSPLLGITKDRYFSRLSGKVYPGDPGFEETRWITSEDVNVEHLLDIFTSIDTDSERAWDACVGFFNHICQHKPRLVMLGPKIEALPDNHPSKAQCLWSLSLLFKSVGNWTECKRLSADSLKLWREQGNDHRVAETLCYLSDVSRQMHLYNEGLQQAREGSEIFERLGETARQAECLIFLAYVLSDIGQLDAAEEAASCAVVLLLERGEFLLVCQGYCVLGDIFSSKGNTGGAIHNYMLALVTASSLNWDTQLFSIHLSLTSLFFGEGRLDDAHAHIESAKPYAINSRYLLAKASLIQAGFWYGQHMFEEAKSEALRVLDVFEELGAADDVETTERFLGKIEEVDKLVASHGSGNRMVSSSKQCYSSCVLISRSVGTTGIE